MTKTSPRTATLLFTILLCFGQLGCIPKKQPVTKPPTLGASYGRILVDSPEVYGRERLARDRLEHKQWLEGQLATVDQADYSKFQGATQQRRLDSTRFRAAVDARIQTALQIEQTRKQAEALDRQARLEELRHEIEVRKLEQELDSLEQQTGEDADGDGGDASDSGGDHADTPSSVLDTLLDDTLAAAPAQLPDTGIAATDLADRPIDVFLEKLAFRERIRQELLENNLDDVHDLDGNTLYRLTFDTTVFPEDDTSAWAVVEVELEDPFDDCSREEVRAYLRPIWERWLDALEVPLNDEADQLQDLVLDPRRSAALLSERERRFVALALAKAQQRGERVPARATRLESLRSLIRDKRKSYLAEPRERRELGTGDRRLDFVKLENEVVRMAALEVIRDEYQSALNPQGDPAFVEIQIEDEERLSTCAGSPRAQHVSNFCKALQRRRRAGAIAAYAITPKVTAERVSSVRAGRAARELALGLAATAGPVQFETAYEKAQVLDAATHAILRRPLVVAFSDVIDPLRLDGAVAERDELLNLVSRAEEAAESARAAKNAAFSAATKAAQELCASASDGSGGSDSPAEPCRKPPTKNQLRFEEEARPIFGWVLGPRFQARHDGAGYDFRFAPHAESLSAVLSVPAWWPRVHLKVRTCWVRENQVPRRTARICAESEAKPTGSGSGSGEDGDAAARLGPFLDRHAEYSVRLGGNNHAITTALDPSRRRPSARLNGGDRLEVGRPGQLVLVGTELWRNPTVTVGTQTADRIDILPDMEGLIATFDSVVRPAGWTSQQRLGREQVWLWTSEGKDYVGVAEIHLAPAATATAPAAQFRMTVPVGKLAVDSHKKASVAVGFQAREDKPAVIFGVEGAEIQSFTVPTSTCEVTRRGALLAIDDLAKGASCTVDLVLRNVAGDTVTLTALQKIAKLKALHPSITLLVD